MKVPALALAGRLRFSHAELAPRPGETRHYVNASPEVMRPLLSSKPPAPALYFKKRSGLHQRIKKVEVSPSEDDPQGVKWYLHHREGDLPEGFWKADPASIRPRLQRRVQPVCNNREFYFHLDFHNLSHRELSLLAYALRPTENFLHRIGAGKAIGLGTVEITPFALLLCDPVARYLNDTLTTCRYHRGWLLAGENPNDWPRPRYSGEAQSIAALVADAAPSLSVLARSIAESNNDVIRAINLLGNRAAVRAPVHTPQIMNQPTDQNNYQWFMRNEKALPGQALPPLTSEHTAGFTELPTLDR